MKISKKDLKTFVEAFKEVTREDYLNMREEFRVLQTSVDNFAKIIFKHDQEITVINHRISDIEKKGK